MESVAIVLVSWLGYSTAGRFVGEDRRSTAGAAGPERQLLGQVQNVRVNRTVLSITQLWKQALHQEMLAEVLDRVLDEKKKTRP